MSLGRILIVDDENATVDRLSELLAGEGYEITVCRTGEEAARSLEEQRVDLLLTDLALPGLDGIALLRHAQKTDPDLLGIIVTVNTAVPSVVEAMRTGAFDYLVKPVQPDILLRILSQAMEVRRQAAVGHRSIFARQKNAELQVQKLSKAVTQTTDAVFITDLEGRIEYVNPAFERMTGFAEAEVIGKTPRIINSGEHSPSFFRELWSTILAGSVFRSAMINRTKSGELFYVSLTITPTCDGGGQVTHFVASWMEITKLRETEKFLKYKNTQSQVVTEAMTAFLEGRNLSKVIALLLNSALEQSKSELGFVGVLAGNSTLRMLAFEGIEYSLLDQHELHGIDLRKLGDLTREVIDTGTAVFSDEPDTNERFGIYPTGHVAIRRFLGVPILRGKEVVGLIGLANSSKDYTFTECDDLQILAQTIGVLHDSSHRHQRESSLEEQLRHAQKMEAVGRLAGGMAHDFNNLITIILGYVDLLEFDGRKDKILTESIDGIKKASKRATHLIQQLLTFSRKELPRTNQLDLNTVINEVDGFLKPLIGEDILLSLDLKAEQAYVLADRGQIEQLILNLAVNARDAMPQGGRLTIKTDIVAPEESSALEHSDEKPGFYVMLAVSDEGQGMDLETQSRIFDPFFTTKPRGKGTGLGLSTVYGIVKQNGGDIRVESRPGRGTSFKIYLPGIKGVDEPTLPNRQGSQDRRHRMGSETILLAEDEDEVRMLIAKTLKEKGYRILTAGDGTEALRVAERHSGSISLIVTDVVMPGGINGCQLVEQLALSRPEMKALYISGYIDDIDLQKDILARGAEFLEKPFTPGDLASKVRDILDH